MGAASDYRALAKRYRSLPEQQVRAGAAEMQKAILTSLKRDTGGDRRLSGFTRRAGRHTPMSVTAKISPGLRLSTATVSASPRKFLGMWSILESGAKDHFVGRLKRKQPLPDGTRPPGGKHMKIGDDWRTGPTKKPSRSPARHTFTDGVAEGTAPAQRAMDDVWERANNG